MYRSGRGLTVKSASFGERKTSPPCARDKMKLLLDMKILPRMF